MSLSFSNINWSLPVADMVGMIIILLGFYLSYRAGRYAQGAQAASLKEEKFFEAYQEVLPLVTENRVKLITTQEYQAKYGLKSPVLSLDITSKDDISRIRHKVNNFLAETVPEWENARNQVLLCLTEAITNVVKHTPGGELLVFLDGNAPHFHIKDRGNGIVLDKLPTMVFVKGFSTAPSLGAGFAIMMRYMKQIEICTNKGGTTIVLHPELHSVATKADLSLPCFERGENDAFSCCEKSQTRYGGGQDHIWQ